jgi:Tol biopolymer transport system component
VFDTLEAGRSWHPVGREPTGAAFLPMVEAEEAHHQLSAKAKRVLADGFTSRWSPDEKKLAFSLGFIGYSGVALFDPVSKETDLLIVPGKDPVWSPDGRYIAFVRDCQVLRVPEFVTAERRSQQRPWTDEEVWIMKSDGTEPRRLAAGGWPSWYRDSTHVYYHSRVDQALCSISIVGPDAQPKRIMACPNPFPAVSPDGQRVAYLEGASFKVRDLALQTVIAEWSVPLDTWVWPRWSTTGDELCLGASAVGIVHGLWIYRLDGREPVKVLGGQIRTGPGARDGTKFVFQLGGSIWTAELDPKVSTIEALGPGQTVEEHVQDMIAFYTRRIEADPQDAYAYSDRARYYDYLHERTKVDADMRRWLAILSGDSGLDAPPAQVDFTLGQATNLGPAINSPGHEQLPCISPDGLELYLSSSRPEGYGGYDIWVAKRANARDPWGPPVNLGSPLNTGSYEAVASMSADGLTLYVEHSRDKIAAEQQDLSTSTRATKDAPWARGSIWVRLSTLHTPRASRSSRPMTWSSISRLIAPGDTAVLTSG